MPNLNAISPFEMFVSGGNDPVGPPHAYGVIGFLDPDTTDLFDEGHYSK
jgi:hypothetical protein